VWDRIFGKRKGKKAEGAKTAKNMRVCARVCMCVCVYESGAGAWGGLYFFVIFSLHPNVFSILLPSD
jgi:hypothetical protein